MENSRRGNWSSNSDERKRRKKFRRFLAGPVTVVASITERSLILEIISRIEGRRCSCVGTEAVSALALSTMSGPMRQYHHAVAGGSYANAQSASIPFQNPPATAWWY